MMEQSDPQASKESKAWPARKESLEIQAARLALKARLEMMEPRGPLEK